MAVQQNKKSPSRGGMRRAANRGRRPSAAVAIATDTTSGDRHLRHHMTEGKYYRGRQIIAPPAEPAADAAEERPPAAQ